MGFQSFESFNLGNFEIPNLGISGENGIWVQAPWPGTKKYYKGEGGDFPQIQAMVSLVNPCLLVVHQCTKNVQITH
jgi:hypothetical protein